MQCAKHCKVLHVHFKVRILGYGNLQTMSMDKRATSKSTQLSTKVLVKLYCSLHDFIDAVFPTLPKQAILPLIQKQCPLFSPYSQQNMVPIFSNYSGKNLHRPNDGS